MDKSFTIKDEYLVLPVRNHGEDGDQDDEGRLTLAVDGRVVLDYGIRFATGPDDVDWYAFFSLARFRGREARVSASNITERGFELVRQADAIPGGETFYTERLRPQFHFTSRTGWLNDPNGLIWYRGEYHLFYQHNPTALPWGNMTWGHAVSRDLVHWTELPKVLFPDAATGTCFSGAAFIDHRNQLGRKSGDDDVIVAFYLRTEIGLCLAYSNDRGRTFTDYEHNPVLNHEGARIDTPRPFWHQPTGRWVAPTYDFFTNDRGQLRRCVGFYSSENLTDWRFESRVEQDGWGDELCGCVDFFQLPLDGDPERLMWVMILIDGSYIVGNFDGSTFHTLAGKPAATDDRIRSLVIQGEYYATMTWHNMPDLRRVQITWMRSRGFYPRHAVQSADDRPIRAHPALVRGRSAAAHAAGGGTRVAAHPHPRVVRPRPERTRQPPGRHRRRPARPGNGTPGRRRHRNPPADARVQHHLRRGCRITVLLRHGIPAASDRRRRSPASPARPHLHRGLRQRRPRLHPPRGLPGRSQPLDQHHLHRRHHHRNLPPRPRTQIKLGKQLIGVHS